MLLRLVNCCAGGRKPSDVNPLIPRSGRAAAGLLAALAITGCATPPSSSPRTAPVVVPASWVAAPVSPGEAVDARWWTHFADPRLEGLVAQAIIANYDLAAAAARIEQAQAQARIAGAAVYPSADVGVSASRARQNFVGLPIPGRGGVVSSISTTVGVALNAAWELDLWGRLRAGERAAASDLGATRAEYAAAALSLAGQTARIYFALVEAREQHALARSTLENRSATATQVRRRYEAGIRPPFDLRLALANEAAANALLAQRARELAALERQLELLTGAYPRGDAAVRSALPAVPPLPDAGAPAQVLARRPDVVAAARRLEAAGSRVAAAQAALYPQLRLAASVGRRASDPADLAESAFSVWSLAGDLLAPVFRGGRLRAEVTLAEARQTEALERYRQALLTAFTEVEVALSADALLAQQVEAVAARVEQTRAAQRLAEDRYGRGLVDFLDVLEAQRQAVEAASQLLAVRRQHLDARIDLFLALGAGFDPAAAPERAATSRP